jgi:hypothetical protein
MKLKKIAVTKSTPLLDKVAEPQKPVMDFNAAPRGNAKHLSRSIKVCGPLAREPS